MNPHMTAIAEDQKLEAKHPAYMSRRDAARHMAVSEKFLATHLVDGPKYLRLGSMVRYRLTDIEAWMHQQEVCR